MGNEASAPAAGGSGGGADGDDAGQKLRAIRQMDATIRQRLRSGASYNMRVVLKGERGSGKSALLARLQGLPFAPEYAPTPEIQTATINWSGSAGLEGADAVKVEVWDVVDRAIRPAAGGGIRGRSGSDGGGLGRSSNPLASPADDEDDEGGGGGGEVADEDAPAGIPLGLPLPASGLAAGSASGSFGLLDAAMVDVYKQCQCAAFVLNPFSATALAYLAREVAQVPAHIPIVLLLNFRDLLPSAEDGEEGGGGHRPVHVTLATLRAFIAGQQQQGGAKPRSMHAFACSMFNCFGLKTLYKYLDLPFLAMKEAVLQQQLEATRTALAATGTAVEEAIARESWGRYVQGLAAGKRQDDNAAQQAEAQPQSQPGQQRARPAVNGVEESKRSGPPPPPPPAPSSSSSSSSSLAARATAAPPPAPSASSMLPRAASPAGEAAMADVGDFAFKPAERSELDAFFADDEDEEEDEAAKRAAAARAEAVRRRESIEACLKPEVVEGRGRGRRNSSFTDDDDDEEHRDGAVGVIDASSPPGYVGLAPVNLSSSSSSSSSSAGAAAAAAAAPALAAVPAPAEAGQGEEAEAAEAPPVPSPPVPSPPVPSPPPPVPAPLPVAEPAAADEPTTPVAVEKEEEEGETAAVATTASSPAAESPENEEDQRAPRPTPPPKEEKEAEAEEAAERVEDFAVPAPAGGLGGLGAEVEEEEEEEEEEDDDVPAGLPAVPARRGNGLQGGDEDEDDDDLPAGLPSGRGVPDDFFDEDEEDRPLRLGGGSSTGGGKAPTMMTAPAYPRPSQAAAVATAAAGAASLDKGPRLDASGASTSGSAAAAPVLSEAARAAIMATMASLEQELGGSPMTAAPGEAAAGVGESGSGSGSRRKKDKEKDKDKDKERAGKHHHHHQQHHDRHERKASSSSSAHRKHKKKSGSREQGAL